MKRAISLLLSVLVLTVSVSAERFDINGDSVTNTVDLSELKLFLAGTPSADIATATFDLNGDGTSDSADLAFLKIYLVTGMTPDELLIEQSKNVAAQNMAYYEEVLSLVNQIRAEVGAAPLTLDTTLCYAATLRSIEMQENNYFSHTRPNGTSCFTVLDTFNIRWSAAGENIAAGYRTPSDVVTGWKNSEGHYKNMINTNYTKLGVGKYGSDYYPYWTQLFIK